MGLLGVRHADTTKQLPPEEPSVVKVETHGVTSVGFLRGSSWQVKEIMLSQCSEIEAYFERDARTRNSEDKVFDKVLYEHINLEHGYKISFYDIDKILSAAKQG